jgi:hypothetical protein
MCSTPLEGLATNGIVHFDPNAYIRDGASQYIAEQDVGLPFDRPLYATPFPGGIYPVPVMHPEQPHRDVYIRHEKHSSPWGTAIIGTAVAALATYLGYELFKDKDPATVTPTGKPDAKPNAKAEPAAIGEKVKDKAKGFYEDAKDFATETKDKVVGWVKGKKGESEVDKVVNEAARGSVKEQTGFFKTRFYKTKIGLGIVAAAGALYALYRVFAGRSHKAPAQSHSSHE